MTDQLIQNCTSYMAPLADAIQRSVENRDIEQMIGLNRIVNGYYRRREERTRGTEQHAAALDSLELYKYQAREGFMGLSYHLERSIFQQLRRENDDEDTFAEAARLEAEREAARRDLNNKREFNIRRGVPEEVDMEAGKETNENAADENEVNDEDEGGN